jgi:UDP-N-acetyl-D-glucosamine dehydrogenase
MTETASSLGSPVPTLPVVVLGQGYVGLALAMRAVEVGHTVVGLDIDDVRVKRLADGDSFVDDLSDERLDSALASGRYHPSSRASPISASSRTPAGPWRPIFVPVAPSSLESTTYPGTTEELLIPTLEAGSGLVAGDGLHVGFSPERIDPGYPRWTSANTPKVVSGNDGPSLASVQSFSDTLVDRTVAVGCPKEAELTKRLEMTFCHVNIALGNELAVFAADLGIDIWKVIDAAATKPFGFMSFTPGPGVGGHCLPTTPAIWRGESNANSAGRSGS